MSLDLSEGSPVAPVGGRRWLVAIGIALFAGAIVLFLFVGADRKPPAMSPSLEHRASLGGRDAQACLSCHARGTARERPNGHRQLGGQNARDLFAFQSRFEGFLKPQNFAVERDRTRHVFDDDVEMIQCDFHFLSEAVCKTENNRENQSLSF